MDKFIERFVDAEFRIIGNNNNIDTECVCKRFTEEVRKLDNSSFLVLLTTAGYIPDKYNADSKEETLFSKLCEVLEVIWALKMGFEGIYITQKSSYEDVNIIIDNSIIVSDTKTFRLSRSQQAPNVKDFVKPEDYRKWIGRFNINKLGGLVVYPQLHEWSRGSDAHVYCSDKLNPIVMLPFHYLAYLYHAKLRLNYDTSRIKELWDYNIIFPNTVSNRIEYWKNINYKILDITGDKISDFCNFLHEANQLLFSVVQDTIINIKREKTRKIKSIEESINLLKEADLRHIYTQYRIDQETSTLEQQINRIKKFRLNEEENQTQYFNFIDKSF